MSKATKSIPKPFQLRELEGEDLEINLIPRTLRSQDLLKGSSSCPEFILNQRPISSNDPRSPENGSVIVLIFAFTGASIIRYKPNKVEYN